MPLPWQETLQEYSLAAQQLEQMSEGNVGFVVVIAADVVVNAIVVVEALVLSSGPIEEEGSGDANFRMKK